MQRKIELTDPRALRALAHPTRLALVALLRQHGSLTATQAAKLLGLNSGSASFHLRQLARYGLVEEVDAPGRQKPWRATAHSTSWPNVTTAPELAAASQVLSAVIVERYMEFMMQWIDRRHDEPLPWQQAAWFGDLWLYLTPEELTELGQRVEDLAAAFEPRMADPALRPPDSRLVTVLHVAAPRPGTHDDQEDPP